MYFTGAPHGVPFGLLLNSHTKGVPSKTKTHPRGCRNKKGTINTNNNNNAKNNDTIIKIIMLIIINVVMCAYVYIYI